MVAPLGILTSALLALAPGCERERRVPYVAPTLHNWPQPYRGVAGLVLHAFHVGTLHVTEGLFLRGGRLTRQRELPVLAYALRHPREGVVVIDTGLNHRLSDEGAGLGGLWGLAMSAELEAKQDLPSQMRAAGLAPEKVRWVIVSNLRFAHAGEVEAFPEARVVVSQAEYEAARAGGGGYVEREFDGVQSWKFVDPTGGAPLGTMPAALDLFGDGSVLLVDARGPTAGTLAVLVRLPSRPVLLAGDLAPAPESVRYGAQPVAMRDEDAWWDRIWRLKRFKELDANLLIVPGHDLHGLAAAAPPEVQRHDFTPATPRPQPTRTPARRWWPGLP